MTLYKTHYFVGRVGHIKPFVSQNICAIKTKTNKKVQNSIKGLFIANLSFLDHLRFGFNSHTGPYIVLVLFQKYPLVGLCYL